jgi:glycosyltransferase involved in cell wall biosynthesis
VSEDHSRRSLQARVGGGWEREPSELSDLLDRLADDPEQLNSAQRQIKEIVAEYRWDAVAAAYGDLYGSLLRGGGGRL